MTRASTDEITGLLLAWGRGDSAALDKLMPLVYDELHRLAHRYMNREAPGHTLQTTGLVNEAYLRLVDLSRVQWQDRAHFFAMTSRLMRQILVDFARSRKYQKRGGNAPHITLDETALPATKNTDLLALDDALNALAKVDARKSKVVEMRFFGGMSVEDTAEALNVSPETVMRDWKTAKIWLLRELSK
jgi:RNA polymerase sigma factor (TIGR02999 family)